MAYFQPSSSERRGIIVLCFILVLAVVVVWLLPNDRGGQSGNPNARSGSANRYYAQPEREVETFPFDPNTADSTTLLRLGLPPGMVRGIYKYRSMGYTYSEPSDFSRVPGMTNEMWERLEPYIQIDRRFQRVQPAPYGKSRMRSAYASPSSSHSSSPSASLPAETRSRDTVRFPVKLQPGYTVELNTSDTSALKKIPGVGSYYARKIVDYRKRLGGFADFSQLEEIDGIPEGIEQYLTLNAASIKKIDVNHATKNQLVRHPYLRVYRASAIWDYRHKYGNLTGLDDLRGLPDFSDEDIRRLAPYLEFK